MKNVLKTFVFICLIGMYSCSEDDDNIQVTAVSFGDIITPSSGTSIILNPLETLSNPAITISWDHAIYSTPTQASYIVEFAIAGTDFADIQEAGGVLSNNYLTLNIEMLNGIATNAGLIPFTEGALDIRVKAGLGSAFELPQYTNTITINVTPYTTELPKIAVPGNHQGWDPATAPLLASSAFGETDYEGYVWLDGVYKFIAPTDGTLTDFAWGNTDWGDDGTFSGVLVDEGEVNCTAAAGYYFVKADTNLLTYSADLHSWGVIGNATPTGWGSDTDMVYDPVTNTLSVTLDLIAQTAPDNGLKFRVNDDWTVNLGDTGADGTMEYSGDNIGVDTSGNYTIILDLSNPREYTYSLILN